MKNGEVKRVLVGMSGGTDSTAACLLLREAGYEVVGLTIQHVPVSGSMQQPAYVRKAVELASRLGMEHHLAHECGRFEESVITPFVNAYLRGLTPNPCVECNHCFKFAILQEWAAELGCEYVATGHYAKTECENGSYYVARGADRVKDQSYFLWKLSQSTLARTLFPLGGMEKKGVRAYLESRGFATEAGSKESMEVCFIESDYREFLRGRDPQLSERLEGGLFVNSTGQALGRHKGYPFYTIGQRKGLQTAFGHPMYVLRTNAEKNTVMLGEKEELLTKCMFVEEPLFVAGAPSGDLAVQIRYHGRAKACSLERIDGEERLLVRFEEPQEAVTPGQSAVFYQDSRVAGGAVIASQRGINQYIN